MTNKADKQSQKIVEYQK